jgi:hypothetical protein
VIEVMLLKVMVEEIEVPVGLNPYWKSPKGED